MKPPPDNRDSIAREVDRLLKKLPGADPTLRGDPEPRLQPRPPGQTTGPRPALVRPSAPPGPTPRERWGAWGRAASGVVLGAALTQWPYPTACGWPLIGYLAAVAVVLVVAGWAALAAWRLRVGGGHVLSLVVAFWGIVLAAEQILPRVGYAAEARTWWCGRSTSASPVEPTVPVVPVAPLPVDAAVRDSSVGR